MRDVSGLFGEFDYFVTDEFVELEAAHGFVSISASMDVGVEAFAQLIAEKRGLLLDVRTPEEFAAGHLEGAVLIDWYGDDFEQKVNELSGQSLLIYCRSGNRSGQACQLFEKQGREAWNLAGGIIAWKQEGEHITT